MSTPKAEEQYEKAVELFENGQGEEALPYIEKAIKLDSNYKDAYYVKGQILSFYLKKYEEALKCFDKVLSIEPGNAGAYREKATAFRNLSKFEEAFSCLDKAIKLESADTEAYMIKASILSNDLERYEEALQCFDKVLSIIPNHIEALSEKALVLESLERYEEALLCYDKALEFDRENDINHCIGKANIFRYKLGKYEEAYQCYDQIIANNPDLKDNFYYDRAELLKTLLRYDEALSLYDDLISRDPESIDYYKCKWELLLNLKRYDEVMECSEKVIALDAPMGYLMKGNTLQEQGKKHEALKWFDKTLALDPEHKWALKGKAATLKEMRKTKEAIPYYDKLIALFPEEADSLASKGNCLEDLGKPKEAMALYDKALALDKGCSDAYKWKCNLLEKQNKIDEAIKVCDMALKNDRRDQNLGNIFFAAVYSNKGYLLRLKGKFQEAWECYSQAIKLEPNNLLHLCNRGEVCYNNLGREKEGLEDFKKAQELLESGQISFKLTEDNLAYVKETLVSVLALQDLEDKAEAQMKQLDKNSAVGQRFLKQFEVLKAEKNKATNNALTKMADKDTSEMQKHKEEMDRVTAAFEEKIKEIQKELANVKTDVRNVNKAVTELKNDFADMKEDLNNKMDDFNKKLDSTLNKLDLSQEDKAKLKEYFRAFVETFTSAHVTAQVVDSGQVVLDVGNSMTSILSTLASFAPFMGDALSKGITSIGEFLKSKEMKSNARLVKGLAADATELSQLVGKSGYEIVLNKSKQQQIIQVTEEDLEATSNSLFKKLSGFVEKLQEKVDVFLYTKLYKTSAARLGHNDANLIIEAWIKGEITPFNTQKAFVQKAIEGHQDETVAVPEGEFSESRGGSRCCNMF